MRLKCKGMKVGWESWQGSSDVTEAGLEVEGGDYILDRSNCSGNARMASSRQT